MIVLHHKLADCLSQQDNAGNIHIWRHGRDPDLANIAIAFELDENRSKATCETAFRVFYELQRENLLCGVTLLGWTSIGEDHLGRQLWETAASGTRKQQSTPELQQFSVFEDVSKFQLSAIFEITDQEDHKLEAGGAQVLVQQIQKLSSSPVSTRSSPRKQLRAPEVCLKGQSAERVGFEAIKAYSAYVGALFDNFD